MKNFFQKHSYSMIKMFLNQFATAVFGFVLVMAAGYAKNVALRNITSVCSIIFYLFLLYTMTWDIGFADRVSVMSGKQKRNLFTGSLISLCANIPNLIFALFITLASLLNVELLSSIAARCTGAALLLEGMYTGLLANSVGGAPLNSHWFMYFVITLPAIITCGIAYLAGLYDKKMTTLFNPLYPESDREPNQGRRKK
ncbi:MAG: hypothetical protein IJX19_07835 [Clostridia bacterium]|nr:hypothetical protein [Clostridia bacterium]